MARNAKRSQAEDDPGGAGRGTGNEDSARGSDTSSTPVVGICSSAGGLDALTRFFDAMPPDSGIAFVVVPHLDPTHESLMVELLQRHTPMSVVQAEDGVPVRPDAVYVIPPNKSLSIQGGNLKLCALEPRGTGTPIDAFLRSLATDQGQRAIAIILSGTGSHGALGITEIKLAGGMVMAQDPLSAEYDSMPRSAIATGMVDLVLEPREMPASLIEYVRHPCPELDQAGAAAQTEDLDRILAIIRARTTLDFYRYRRNMLLRRVQRRMGLSQIHALSEYERRLREDPEEVTALCKDLLIGVTAFFREPEAFVVLEQRVIPKLVERNAGDVPVRVWVPACATGEEAYSIGILMVEAFEQAKRVPSFQIFASDLDLQGLEIARRGVYPGAIAGAVTENRLRRFFVKAGDGYQVCKQLRDAVVFAQQNLIADAPFSRIDLISCRNFLIYLQPELQAKVVRLLHFALNDDGYLLLGPSESIAGQTSLFETVSKKWRVFRRLGPTRHDLVDIPILGTAIPRSAGSDTAAGGGRREYAGQRVAELAHRVLLSHYVPASVLIDKRYEILYYHGPTVQYLEFPSGHPSTGLLTTLRPGLRNRVRAAVLTARETGEVVVDEEAR